MGEKNKKLYVIKKYVYADDVMSALMHERDVPVDDIWVDDEWRKNNKIPDNRQYGYKT